MGRSSIAILLAASALLGSCTLLVDGRLDKAGTDDDDGAITHVDGGSDEEDAAGDDGGGDAPDAGPGADPSRDAANGGERDANGEDPSRDAGQTADGATGADAAQPDSPEVQACAGDNHACAVSSKSGAIVCWGENQEDQAKFASDRSYRRVACGDFHSCALDSAGGLVCVGRNRNGQRVTQAGPFDEVAAGDAHTCVLDSAGSARCFGLDSGGQSTPPALPLRSLTAGRGFTCAIRRADSKVQCWGFGATDLTNAVADTAFSSIDAGPTYVCGVTTKGALRCWSLNPPPAPDLALKVSAGGFGACALLSDHSVRCWNGNDLATPHADKGPFRDVIVGGTGRCLLPMQGAILCEPSAPSSALSPGPASFE